MASNLEVLVIIPTVTNFAVNRSSPNWSTWNQQNYIICKKQRLNSEAFYHLAMAIPHIPKTPPIGYPEGCSWMLSPTPQNTCRLVAFNLPHPLEYPCEDKELIQRSTTRTKTSLFLLNPRFNKWMNSRFQYPAIGLPKSWGVLSLYIWNTPPHPHLKDRTECLSRGAAAEVCQPRQLWLRETWGESHPL